MAYGTGGTICYGTSVYSGGTTTTGPKSPASKTTNGSVPTSTVKVNKPWKHTDRGY